MPLTIKPPSRPVQSPSSSASPLTVHTYQSDQDREASPEPPPASPLTPVARPAKPATQPDQAPQAQAHFIQQPPSLPFSAEESSDAIALRAAISSLQFQRVQAQNDLRVLEGIKRQAVAHPEEFRQHLLSKEKAKPQPPPWETPFDSEEDREEDAVIGADRLSTNDSTFFQPGSAADSHQLLQGSRVSYGSMLHPQTSKILDKPPNFPPVPLPQDVVRCPPIEWAKYNIVGESLDKLHQHQKLRPGGDENGTQRDSVIAAPYNPFVDRLSEEQQQYPTTESSSTNRKDSGASAPEQPVQRRRSSKAFS